MESKIREAMLSRLSDFKSQADNLTMEGVRRALEKELKMERLSLDPYRKFIKQCVEKYFNDDENENASEAEEKTEEPVHSVEEKEIEEKEGKNKKNLTNSSASLNKNSEDSEMSHESPGNEEINEDIIKKAIKKRAAYFKGNLETTMVKVRCLLEEDLKLEKGSLDAHKKLISSELEKTLQSSDVVDNTNSTKKVQKISNKKVIRKVNKDPDSSNSDEEPSEDTNEAAKRSKKRPAQKIKNDTKASKKQKVQVESKKMPKKKLAEEDSDENSDSKSSEDTDEVKVVKKQTEKPTPAYGKKVERLRSIIKSCGLGIPPAVYRRAKQAPESKREAELVKELVDILQKEGLSTNPSDKEIQEVKKRKQRAKDLEGIDTSNIVSSSRRRASNFIPIPPPPKIEDSESEEEEEEEEEDEENEEDSEVHVSDAEAEVSDDVASDAGESNAQSADEVGDESD